MLPLLETRWIFIRQSLLATLTLAIGLSAVLAANDWSKPCFDGECAYDMLESTGASGILKLHASPKALTDITPAAGWVILECDPNTLDQDIRLVCQDDHSESGCRHLLDHGGPVDKIVRLPEGCGHGPFARVAQMSVAEDQSLPAHAENKVQKRDGVAPQVHTMRIDGNFAAVDPAKAGGIKFAFVGVNAPGYDLNEAFADGVWDDIANWVKKAVDTVAKAVNDGAKWVVDRINDVSKMIKDKTHFEIKPTVESSNISVTTKPLDWTQKLSIGKCPVGKVGASLECKGWLQAKAGIVLIGSVVPPSIDDMAAFGGIRGEFDALLKLELLLKGGFTVEKKVITDYGLPGLSIPKIITIGPYISLDGKVQGHVELDVKTKVHLNYALDNLELWYPESAAKKYSNHHGIRSKDSDLTLEATASITAKGFIQGTITPKIHVGVSVGGGVATASMYLGADAWLRGSISAIAEGSASNKRDLSLPASDQSNSLEHFYSPPYASRLRKRDEDAASASFRGCFWLDTGLHLYGGAKGQLWKWKAKKEFTIWDSPVWQIYSKCWSLGSATGGKITTKPQWTIAQVNKLSAAPKNCPTGKKMTKRVTDKVPGKTLNKA